MVLHASFFIHVLPYFPYLLLFLIVWGLPFTILMVIHFSIFRALIFLYNSYSLIGVFFAFGPEILSRSVLMSS